MQKHSAHKSVSGFTLIELLIVIAIIGIIAAIAIKNPLVGEGGVSSKIAKIYGVHAGVPSSGAPFILQGGYK